MQKTKFVKFPLIIILLFVVGIGAGTLALANNCGQVFDEPGKKSESKPLTKVDPNTFEYRGLTPEGLQALTNARDALQHRSTLYSSRFRNLSAVHHQYELARAYQAHMLLYGPHGAAKSGVVDFGFSGESTPAFEIQLYQTVPEMALIGGQNFETAKTGEYQLNSKGSIADYKIAKIDEFEKGSPGVLAVLLGAMNRSERKIYAGNRVIPVKTESVFLTSNASLPELLDMFIYSNQGSTAQAFFDRITFKAFNYNWLSAADQAHLDGLRQRKAYLQAIAKSHPDVLKDNVFQKPQVANWEHIRELAASIVVPSDLFTTTLRNVVNSLREQTFAEIRASQERFKNNRDDEVFPYFPTCDFSERTRQTFTEIIQMSVFLDLLKSPIVAEKGIDAFKNKQIVLDPLSIWRLYTAVTTVLPGSVALKYDPNAKDQKFTIDFDWKMDASQLRDKRQEKMIEHLRGEQDRLRRVFGKYITEVQDQIQIRSRHALRKKDSELGDDSIELMLLSGNE